MSKSLKIVETMERVGRSLQQFYGSLPIPRAEIVRQVAEECGCSPGSVLPSDHCYDRTNNGIRRDNNPMFLHVGGERSGKYLFVGFNYPYAGPIHHFPKDGLPEQSPAELDVRRLPEFGSPAIDSDTVTIDTAAIKRRLFEDPVIRARLVRDYELPSDASDPEVLASALLHNLGQTPVQSPLANHCPNRDVFRAAVRALGSNSRSWATFLKHERRLAELLRGYDAVQTNDAAEQGVLTAEELKSCLPGQSSTNDALAILRWARLLSEVADYYAFLCALGRAFSRLAEETYHRPLADADLLPCVAGYLGKPPALWKGENYLGSAALIVPFASRKTPGMSYVLASEFLRNLGWTGFKPDRHVERLFDCWLPHGTEGVEKQVRELAQLIGHADRNLQTYLAYSQLGARLSPTGVPLSHVDNMVWLLGAYVEKKGNESHHSYLRARSAGGSR